MFEAVGPNDSLLCHDDLTLLLKLEVWTILALSIPFVCFENANTASNAGLFILLQLSIVGYCAITEKGEVK